MGEGGEESGIIVGRWGGQLLWETYVPGIWYGAKVEYDLAKTMYVCMYVCKFLACVDNKKRKNLFICIKSKFVCFVYCIAILSRKKKCD